jgi:hypothetical protein
MTRAELLSHGGALSGRRGVAEDRCDRCCAPAHVYVVLPTGLDLVFCAHHARKLGPELREAGALMRGDGLPESRDW